MRRITSSGSVPRLSLPSIDTATSLNAPQSCPGHVHSLAIVSLPSTTGVARRRIKRRARRLILPRLTSLLDLRASSYANGDAAALLLEVHLGVLEDLRQSRRTASFASLHRCLRPVRVAGLDDSEERERETSDWPPNGAKPARNVGHAQCGRTKRLSHDDGRSVIVRLSV